MKFRAAMDSLQDLPALGTRAELAEDFGSYWFGGAQPSGAVVTDDGYHWEFTDFIPGPKIEYLYGVTSIPCKLSELNIPAYFKLDDLKRIRQLLVAAYGGAPQDPKLGALLSHEFWYRPDPNFSEANLDRDRKAVLAEVDRRIAAASK